MGAESVSDAGHAISRATETFSAAAGGLDFTLNRLSPLIEEWVSRIEAALRPQEEQVSESKPFEGWAIVELMGHRRIGGRVSEQEMAGTKMLRVEIPGDDATTYATQFYGGAAIYCLTPTTEEMARAAARASRPEPVTRWELPQPKPVEKARAFAHNASTCGGSGECGDCAAADAHDAEPSPDDPRVERYAAVGRIRDCTKCAIPAAFESHTCREEDHAKVCKVTMGCYDVPGHSGECDQFGF